MSAVDAVDGSSTGTQVPWMWVLLMLPQFLGPSELSHLAALNLRQIHAWDPASRREMLHEEKNC
jgi:hypothetical protein